MSITMKYLSLNEFSCKFSICRRPSGNPDKDICDHIMQVKLAYKEQLTHILQQVLNEAS